MKLYTNLAIITALSFSGCTNPLSSPEPTKTSKNFTYGYIGYDKASDAKIVAFKKDQRKVGLLTKQDPHYKSFAPVLGSEESKTWFNNNMYLLWDRQITRKEYIAQGIAKFPTYKHEFTFIAQNF